jgi:hypothetical protein
MPFKTSFNTMRKTPQTIQAILQASAKSEFWKIICEELDDRIEKLEKERDSDSIASLPADAYKLAMENIKDKITHLGKLKDLPKEIIQRLDNPDLEDEELDPYPKE